MRSFGCSLVLASLALACSSDPESEPAASTTDDTPNTPPPVNPPNTPNNPPSPNTPPNNPPTTPSPDGVPAVGGCEIFPADNAWNLDVSGLPVHANSDNYIDSIGRDDHLHPDFGTEWEGEPIGIPYTVVSGSQSKVPINYVAYGDESDPGPMPFPLDVAIEGGPDSDGDRHSIVIDESTCTLYELYRAFPNGDGFDADSGTVWDLTKNENHPEGCTSTDAAGLPVFPGLARYEEVVEKGEVLHALRFTVSDSQRGYIFPARHYASDNDDPNLAPMGLRLRMKASYDCSGYSDEVQVLCTGLKRFGMIMADNGSNWYVSGSPDPRWSDDNLNDFKDIPGDAFEVVDTGDPIVTDSPDCQL